MSVCVNFSQADGRHNRLFSSRAGVLGVCFGSYSSELGSYSPELFVELPSRDVILNRSYGFELRLRVIGDRGAVGVKP